MCRLFLLMCAFGAVLGAQTPQSPDWARVEEETMRHFQTLLRFDTSDPPGTEIAAAEYLKKVLEAEGIPVQTFALEPARPNVVARLKGSGAKRPLLIMGHTDVVNVDPKKWTHPPFSATREGGYVYGRGTVDDKDNVTAALMVMMLLKRQNVPLDRDVIFLAESGEEGSTRVGIQYMVNEHFAAIDAEYCLAEGGSVTRTGGRVKFASVQTIEKIPRGIELTARGPAGHGSVPLRTNAILHLANAIGKVAAWKPPIRLNDTTRAYFKRLATLSTPADARRYLAVVSADPKAASAADEYFLVNEPRHASMLRTSVSPNIIQGGYRINVIPSEARATLDVRIHPDDDHTTVHRGGAEGHRRSGHRRAVGAARRPARQRQHADRFGRLQGHRVGDHQELRGPGAADDEHGGDRYGVPAGQRRAVLRHRPRDRSRGRTEGVRRAQRSGADPRTGAAPVRQVPLRGGDEPRRQVVGL